MSGRTHDALRLRARRPPLPLPNGSDWQYEIRYTGRTLNTRRRRWQHIRNAQLRRGNAELGRWIRGLLRLGLRPEIHCLRACPSRYAAEVEESALIRQMRQTGYHLLNRQHNTAPRCRRWPRGRRLPKGRRLPRGRKLRAA